jgi:hypothetical protein
MPEPINPDNQRRVLIEGGLVAGCGPNFNEIVRCGLCGLLKTCHVTGASLVYRRDTDK